MNVNPFYPEILKREEVAGILRVQPSTVDALARRGDMPSIRLGRHRRFVRDDVFAYVDSQRQSNP
jgi:excisionase family DNA binding protein